MLVTELCDSLASISNLFVRHYKDNPHATCCTECLCVCVCVCVCVCWKGERLELLGGIEITLQVLTNPTPCSLVMPENEATHSHIPTFPGRQKTLCSATSCLVNSTSVSNPGKCSSSINTCTQQSNLATVL